MSERKHHAGGWQLEESGPEVYVDDEALVFPMEPCVRTAGVVE